MQVTVEFSAVELGMDNRYHRTITIHSERWAYPVRVSLMARTTQDVVNQTDMYLDFVQHTTQTNGFSSLDFGAKAARFVKVGGTLIYAEVHDVKES